MNIDEVLDKLEGVQQRGAGFVALCPAHEDSNPSLSVDGEGENVLLRCHAGCSFESIAKAIGMGGKREKWSAENAEAIYDYVDERGSLLFQVLRMPGKEFPSRHLDGSGEWKWGLEGVKRVPYRLPQVIEGVQQGKWIVICEGEKDADAVCTHADPNKFVGTCNAGGAGKWRKEYSAYLKGASVIIWADKDEPGRNHAETVRKSLAEHGVAQLAIVQSAVGKDAHDHLVGANLSIDAVDRAENQFLLQRGIVTARDLAARAREDLEMTEDTLPGFVLIPGVDLKWRQGRFYAIGGYTGDGKTSSLMHGVRTLAGHYRKKGGVFSLEMPERDLRNKLISHRGIPLELLEEPWRLKFDPVMLARYEQAIAEIAEWDLDIIFDTQVTAERIAEITQEREYGWIAIDHIHRFGWGQRRDLEAQVTRLTNIAIEQNVMVIALCQLREPRVSGKDLEKYPQPTLQDFRETGVVGQEASMAISVWRRRHATGLAYIPNVPTSIQILKNRHATGRRTVVGTEFFMDYDEATGLYAPQSSINQVPAPTPQSEEEALQNDDWFRPEA